RAFHVTGVQTCALPIYPRNGKAARLGRACGGGMTMEQHHIIRSIASLPLEGRDRGWGSVDGPQDHPLPSPPLKGKGAPIRNCRRSEERRVGQESIFLGA